MNLSMSLCIPFQKKSLWIKEYVLFVPACPCRLLELTMIDKAKDLGSTRAPNDLYASWIIFTVCHL